MTDRTDILDKALVAALGLAAEKAWAHLTLTEIAGAAGLSLTDFHAVADKDDIAAHVEAYFDRAMSAEPADAGAGPAERLFDTIMLRFEAMEPHRDGLMSLIDWRMRSPVQLARLLKARRASAKWALASAGLDTNEGGPLSLKVLNTAWVLSQTDLAWRKEKSPDFTRTMSTLDRELKDAEGRMNWLSRITGGRRKSATDTAQPAEPADA